MSSRTALLRLLPALLVALAALFGGAGLAAAERDEVARYGVYLNNARVGSMVSTTRGDTFEQQPAIRMEVVTSIALTTLGTPVEQKINLTHVTNTGGAPLLTRLDLESLGRKTVVDARYEASRVLCEIDVGGQTSSRIVPIPEGVSLIADPQLSRGLGDELKVGQKMSLHFFEPITLSIQSIQTEVLQEETRSIGGEDRRVFLMRTTNSITGNSDSWVDETGRMLEDRSSLGIRFVREDLGAESPTLAYEPPQDFAIATAVRTEIKLPDPKAVRRLRVRISGLPDAGLILSDARQQVSERSEEADGVSAVYLIQAREVPGQAAGAADPGASGEGLGEAPYLGVGTEEIRKQAAALRGEETDRAIIARRVRAWVRGHMQKLNNVGTPRSAVEIMESRDGVCRDYATLFAAVARAAGVPTRVCGGIVYFNDAFFYHAWVECRLTDDAEGWQPFDPTLDEDFVSATHIKFAQGDPTDMFASARAIGRIKVEILEHR
jgi:hypothetical protein